MVHVSALDEQLSDLLGNVGVGAFYVFVWGLVFVGTALFVGAFIPFVTGDSLLFAAGIIAATASSINIWVLAIGVGVAAFLGDQVAFILGRRFGRPYLDNRGGPRTKAAIAKTEKFYTTFGWWSVVIARFMPWARVFVPVIAGIGRMNYYRFLSANILGAIVWGVGMTVVGFFAASIPGVKIAAYIIGGSFILAAVVAGIGAWRADRRDQANRSVEAA
jgi:membrane-associated protein